MDATSEEDLSQADVESQDASSRQHRRIASVFDAVAGRVGLHGFLSESQLEAGATTLTPEEVLLRRVNAPAEITRSYYHVDEDLGPDQKLPDAEVVKALHVYASDYYAAHGRSEINHNYRSLDETALLAFAILVEEAAAEVLGENGDMVLVEPEGLENGLPESAMTRHQVKGRVKRLPSPDPTSSEETSTSESQASEDDRKMKRQKRG